MRHDGRAIYLRLAGHLTANALRDALANADPLPPAGAPMIVDCLTMTGYDSDARADFVRWHREMRGRIEAVAIVTDRPLWRLVISAMSLASGQTMKPFDDLASAEAWAAERRAG